MCTFKYILSQKTPGGTIIRQNCKRPHKTDASHSQKLREHTHSTAQTSSICQTVGKNVAYKYPAEMLEFIHLSCDCKPWGGKQSWCEFASLRLPGPGRGRIREHISCKWDCTEKSVITVLKALLFSKRGKEEATRLEGLDPGGCNLNQQLHLYTAAHPQQPATGNSLVDKWTDRIWCKQRVEHYSALRGKFWHILSWDEP